MIPVRLKEEQPRHPIPSPTAQRNPHLNPAGHARPTPAPAQIRTATPELHPQPEQTHLQGSAGRNLMLFRRVRLPCRSRLGRRSGNTIEPARSANVRARRIPPRVPICGTCKCVSRASVVADDVDRRLSWIATTRLVRRQGTDAGALARVCGRRTRPGVESPESNLWSFRQPIRRLDRSGNARATVNPEKKSSGNASGNVSGNTLGAR